MLGFIPVIRSKSPTSSGQGPVFAQNWTSSSMWEACRGEVQRHHRSSSKPTERNLRNDGPMVDMDDSTDDFQVSSCWMCFFSKHSANHPSFEHDWTQNIFASELLKRCCAGGGFQRSARAFPGHLQRPPWSTQSPAGLDSWVIASWDSCTAISKSRSSWRLNFFPWATPLDFFVVYRFTWHSSLDIQWYVWMDMIVHEWMCLGTYGVKYSLIHYKQIYIYIHFMSITYNKCAS